MRPPVPVTNGTAPGPQAQQDQGAGACRACSACRRYSRAIHAPSASPFQLSDQAHTSLPHQLEASALPHKAPVQRHDPPPAAWLPSPALSWKEGCCGPLERQHRFMPELGHCCPAGASISQKHDVAAQGLCRARVVVRSELLCAASCVWLVVRSGLLCAAQRGLLG